jgi:hypothetical protein
MTAAEALPSAPSVPSGSSDVHVSTRVVAASRPCACAAAQHGARAQRGGRRGVASARGRLAQVRQGKAAAKLRRRTCTAAITAAAGSARSVLTTNAMEASA